jgi:hypothetical protein
LNAQLFALFVGDLRNCVAGAHAVLEDALSRLTALCAQPRWNSHSTSSPNKDGHRLSDSDQLQTYRSALAKILGLSISSPVHFDAQMVA